MNIRAIYPPSNHYLPNGCSSCGGDVKLDHGFVDLDLPPYKGYLCVNCVAISIGPNKADELLQEAQENYRKVKR